MLNQFSRTQLLLGKEAMEILKNSRVAVFGIGGVGGYVCEALVRSGVGAFVPSVAGLILAGEVVKDLTREENRIIKCEREK